jgi:hypothetical protein
MTFHYNEGLEWWHVAISFCFVISISLPLINVASHVQCVSGTKNKEALGNTERCDLLHAKRLLENST